MHTLTTVKMSNNKKHYTYYKLQDQLLISILWLTIFITLSCDDLKEF